MLKVRGRAKPLPFCYQCTDSENLSNISFSKVRGNSVLSHAIPFRIYVPTDRMYHGLPLTYWRLLRVLPVISSRNARGCVLFTPKWHLTPVHAITQCSMDEWAMFSFTALQCLYSSQHRTSRAASTGCCRRHSPLFQTNGKSGLQKALRSLPLLLLTVTKLKLQH